MEWTWEFLVQLIKILSPATLVLLSLYYWKSGSNRRLPPGPPGLPVFGHLFILGTMPHRKLAGLRKKYGPVIWLRLGSINTMVVQTAKAAEDMFKNHDANIASRTITEIMRSHDYHQGSLALAPYGAYWRMLRRICTLEMFVTKRINDSVGVRRKSVDSMLSWIEKEANDGQEIHLAKFVFLALFNMLGNVMFSRDLVDPESKVGSEFFTCMMGLMETGGTPNVSDLFPLLKRFDLQRIRKKMDGYMGKALEIASGYVKERLREQEGVERKKDFLDVLLEFEGNGKDEPDKMSEHAITVFILEIFLAGSETTSASTEWAMTELLCNPDKLIKVKEELKSVVGPNRKFEESDIENAPYLQAVMKETLRLHPPVPFLIPRIVAQDTNFMGYDIPKDTQVFVNAWAIGRDPECWDDPLAFKPERFLGSKVDYRGQNFELIPFGAGRRICVGLPLAHRLLNLVMGSLLHEFDWEIERGVTPQTMDMRDRIGVAVRKLHPLKTAPKKCTF